jgi:hypothetical protein
MREQHLTRFTYTKVGIVFAVLMLCMGFDCSQPPPDPIQTGGIRIKTQEAIAGIGNSEVPVPGCGHAGHVIVVDGPGSGTQTSIEGVTGTLGISDYPNARTNAEWDMSVSYLAVIKICGTARQTFSIPTVGSQITWTCFLFRA